VCLLVSVVVAFTWGARAGVFAFPAVQLAFGPVSHVIATGALMTLIGALFLLRRRPARASAAADAARTT
jgi:glycerol-3-phosphate acyltransferase PlsY